MVKLKKENMFNLNQKLFKIKWSQNLKWSQNFLKNPKLVKYLVGKSSIGEHDVVYEIGPGKGIITEQLASQCQQVVAIEKDPRLYQLLRQKFKENNKVKIKFGDFLKYQLPLIKRFKVFSNIPFNITADIIKKLTSLKNPPVDTYLIIQKEAARKYMGLPRETQCALLLKPWFKMKIIHQFKPTDFQPVPKVDIVLLQIKKRERPLIEKNQTQLYRDFIVYGFNQGKPTLKKALKKIFTHQQFIRLAENLKFSKLAKPTDLNFNQWFGLFDYFVKNVEKTKQELVYGAEKQLRYQQAKLTKVHRTRVKKT